MITSKSELSTILIVEDDEISFILLEEMLKINHYTVLRAKNGAEAVSIIQNNTKIDLILMDLVLPKLNGFEATKQIRKIQPKLPIIAQTAIPQDQALEKDYLFEEIIFKPINYEKLNFTIKKFIYKKINYFIKKEPISLN